jgi:hypothetical protein
MHTGFNLHTGLVRRIEQGREQYAAVNTHAETAGLPVRVTGINPAIKYTNSCCVGDTWMPEIRTDSLGA